MEMTIDNLCNSCTNIGCEFQSGIVRTKCAFYIPPHIEPDNCGNYAIMQPKCHPQGYWYAQTVEAIPKADHEARLKADMVAMLEELQSEIEESCICTYEVTKLIQQKISELKENKE